MNSKGRNGEDFAARELSGQGYEVLARNYFSRYGEIDIVAAIGEEICFIEVKTRRRNAMVSGLEAVTRTKQRKIIKTALSYIQQTNCPLQPRFDIFSVETDKNGVVTAYDHMKGAFDGSAYENHEQTY